MATLGNATTLVIQANGSGTVQVYDFSKEPVSISDGEICYGTGQIDKTFVYSGDSEADLFAAIKRKLGQIGQIGK